MLSCHKNGWVPRGSPIQKWSKMIHTFQMEKTKWTIKPSHNGVMFTQVNQGKHIANVGDMWHSPELTCATGQFSMYLNTVCVVPDLLVASPSIKSNYPKLLKSRLSKTNLSIYLSIYIYIYIYFYIYLLIDLFILNKENMLVYLHMYTLINPSNLNWSFSTTWYLKMI